MQIRNVYVWTLAIMLSMISIYFLSYTLVGTKLKKAEQSYVKEQKSKLDQSQFSKDSLMVIERGFHAAFRDSFKKKPFLDLGIIKYKYKTIKEFEIKRGLDLQGGMSFVLEVQTSEVLKSLSQNSKNEIFQKALIEATKMQSNSQGDYLSLFQKAYTNIDPNAKLADIFANIQSFQDRIKHTDDNATVINVLREKVSATYKNSFNVIKTRINQSGLTEPNIALEEGSGRIIIELPGADDETRVRSLLESSAKLEFWHCYDNREIIQSLISANDILKNILTLKKQMGDSTNVIAAVDTSKNLLGISTNSSGKNKEDSAKEANYNPLFDVLGLNVNQGNPVEGPVVGYALAKNIRLVNEYLGYEQIKAVLKKDLKLLWGAKPVGDDGDFYQLYAVKSTLDGRALLGGEAISNSYFQTDPSTGKPGITMQMNAQGAAIWESMTGQAAADPQGHKSIAIVLDNLVQSAPTVQNKISGGNSQITGSFEIQEATDMANILNSGKLEAPAKIIQEEVVGPTLGEETIKKGILSLLIGLCVIFAFMVVNYKKGGLIADFALVINLVFLLGILASFRATLTLPGIAGIVLIIGAAVDANVIIYERIKDEMHLGKTYINAVMDGFKNSYSAIVDANVTTLITSITLMFFGYGPVKGFAVTLTIGVITSLFTAVLLSREFYKMHLNNGGVINFGTSIMDRILGKFTFSFIKKRKIAYIISCISIIVGTISMFTRGFDLGVDFKGGRSFVIAFDQNVSSNDLAPKLNANLSEGTQVKKYGSDNQVQIVTSFLYDSETANSTTTDSIVLNKIYESLKGSYAKMPTYEEFLKNVSNSVKINATIADDIRNSAWQVSIIAIVLIFIYVWIRFPNWQFAAGAIAALVHDLFFTLGILSLLKGVLPFTLEMNQTIIAAILTIVGYSTNDTVVIFDRIREYLLARPNDPLEETVDAAVNKTLSRTLMTSSTLILVTMVLFLFGGDSIKAFSFTMIIGILVGTYSSIFVASPVAVDLMNWFNKKK